MIDFFNDKKEWEMLTESQKKSCTEHYFAFLRFESGKMSKENYFRVLKAACVAGTDLTIIPEGIKQPIKEDFLSSGMI